MNRQLHKKVIIVVIFGVNVFSVTQLHGATEARIVLEQVKSSDPKVHEKGKEELRRRTPLRALLSASKDKQVASMLRDIAEKEDDEDIKNKAIYGLAGSHEEETAQLMQSLTRNAKSRDSRIAAMHTLVAAKRQSAIPYIKQALAQDPDLLVKFNAARNLGELGDNSGLSLGLEKLKDRDMAIRIEAARVVGAIGDPSTIRDLEMFQKVGREEEGAGRAAINEIELKRISANDRKLQYLKRALHSKNASCGWAARKLAELGTKDAVQVLLDASRTDPKYDSEEFAAKGCAEPIFKSLYWDGTQLGEVKIQTMLKTGIVLDLPN